jgi:hypothetical protein
MEGSPLMTSVRAIVVAPVVSGALLIGSLLAMVPNTDPEPFPYHQPLALVTTAVDPEPFPWQSDDRVKVRYPWLPA